jgi:hypothetical protein
MRTQAREGCRDDQGCAAHRDLRQRPGSRSGVLHHKLGLEKVQDESYGESGARWITVSPKGARIRIVLKKAEKEHEKAMVGNSDGAPPS